MGKSHIDRRFAEDGALALEGPLGALWDSRAQPAANSDRHLTPCVTEPRLSRLRVLLVEDNTTNQLAIEDALVQEGARVVIAHNGRAAVDTLEADPDGFDLVLMDVHMPQLDGHGATRLIRGRLGLRTLPVIAMTAGCTPDEVRDCLEAGMDAHICKPVDIGELAPRICHVLETRGATQEHAEPSASSEPVDVDSALRRLSGNHRLLAERVRFFAAKHQTTAAGLARGAAGQAPWPTPSSLHDLRGEAAMLGAARIAYAARELECRLRAGARPQARAAAARELARAFQEDLPRLVVAVETWSHAPAPSPALSTDELARELDTLARLLAARNMRASSTHRAIAPALSERDPEAAASLDAALQRLDFDEARRLCLSLSEPVPSR